MKKLMFLIAGISTVLFGFAMEQDPASQLREQQQSALKYINEHNLKENSHETSYKLLEAIAKKDIVEVNAIIENFPSQARPALLNGLLDVYNVKNDKSKQIAYPHLYKCYRCIIEKCVMEKGSTYFLLTPLIVAVVAADEKILQALFEHGVHIDVNKGFPLQIAVEHGLEAIPFLLQKGAKGIDIDKAFYDAVAKGNIPAGQELLKAGALLNRKDSKTGLTPLQVACRKGHSAMVKLLLEKGSLVDETDSAGWTPLHRAAYDGNSAIVNLLLEHGANVNSKSKSGLTPLHFACDKNHPDIVKLLLGKGALVEETIQNGQTSLHLAAWKGNLAIANVLLEHGANVNSKDSKSGLTPLYIACVNDHGAVVKLLLEKGAFIEETDLKGQTPLHWAVEKDHADIVKLLLKKGAFVDAADLKDQTPLRKAVWHGNFSIVNLLLEHGANVNSSSISQLIPLHVACRKNHVNIVKFLLEKGAFVDATDLNGFTPLHYAAYEGNFSIVNLLLEHGANVLAKDKDGGTIIEFISTSETLEAMELLKQGAPYPRIPSHQKMLEEGDFGGKLEGSSFFYQNYFKALTKGDTQGTLAAIAQVSSNDINKATQLMDGLTALHWAVLQNNRKAIETLIANAKPIAKPNRLQTIASYVPIVSWYVPLQPVNINCRDVNGRTPLMWAARLGHIHIYRDLKRAGAKHAFRDKKGKMGLNYAADYRNIDIIREMIIDGTLSAKSVTNSN